MKLFRVTPSHISHKSHTVSQLKNQQQKNRLAPPVCVCCVTSLCSKSWYYKEFTDHRPLVRVTYVTSGDMFILEEDVPHLRRGMLPAVGFVGFVGCSTPHHLWMHNLHYLHNLHLLVNPLLTSLALFRRGVADVLL